MSAWWLLFTSAMLISPLVFTLCVRQKDDPDANPARARRLTWALLGATLASFAIMILVWQLWAVRPAVFTWTLFFALFFFLANPAISAKNPAWNGASSAKSAVRAAAISGDRAHASPVPQWVWPIAWAYATLALALIAIRPLVQSEVLEHGLSSNEAIRWITALAVSLVMIPSMLITLPIGIRASMREPEPMDTAHSPELAAAYTSLRNAKAWFFAGLFLTMLLVMSAAMVGVAWVPSDPRSGTILGWAGAIVGSLLGIAGAIGGTYLSNRRVRVNTLLRQLQREQRQHTATA